MNAIAQNDNQSQSLRAGEYERFLPMVRRNAIRIGNKFHRLVTVSDLISVGWIGLLEALARSRDTVPDAELESFVVCRVRGAMFDYLRKLDPATRRNRDASRRMAETIEALTGELGKPPEAEQIAARLEVEIDEYHELASRATTPRQLSLDSLVEARLTATTPRPDEAAAKRLLIDKVTEAIGSLPERQQMLVTWMYQEGRSQKEIAEELSVGAARVCQLHSDAIRRLQTRLGAA